MCSKIRSIEEEGRKNNTVMFEMEEKRNERYGDTFEAVTKFLKEITGLKPSGCYY
jgi:hypothetical protein